MISHWWKNPADTHASAWYAGNVILLFFFQLFHLLTFQVACFFRANWCLWPLDIMNSDLLCTIDLPNHLFNVSKTTILAILVLLFILDRPSSSTIVLIYFIPLISWFILHAFDRHCSAHGLISAASGTFSIFMFH